MWSFHTPTQKSTPKIHPNHLSPTHFQKSSKSPCFTTKIAPRQKFTPYRTPYRQSPYFTTLFRPLSHKIQLKIFTNSLSHPNFLPYIKGIFTMYYFYVKKSHFRKYPTSTLWRHTRLQIYSRIIQSLSARNRSTPIKHPLRQCLYLFAAWSL